MISDPYRTTHFEPGCPQCDNLWQELLAASSSPDWEAQALAVTARIRAHARDAHGLALAAGGEQP